MAGYRVETKHTSFDSPLTIHPWDGLVKQLCDNIDPGEINRLIFLARRQLGDRFGEIKDQRDCKCEAFFTALRDKFEDESADVVLNLFECENLHNDQGACRFADYITKYKEEKHKYDKDNKTLKNVDFIGRESLVTKITTYLLCDRPVGVILCGMSGMGKTAVANEVSWRLKCQKPQWKIVRLSEMEKTDIRDLYKNLIYTLLETFPSDLNLKLEDEVTALKCHLNLVFNTVLVDRVQNILIYIDNVDDHCLDRQALREFEGFLTELVRLIHVPRSDDIKVRVLITVQKKIFGELDPSAAEVSWAGGNIVQLEVKPMDDTDAAAILRKQSRLSEKDLTEDQCCSINKSVGGNPMALLQVAIDLPFVRTFNRGFDELISSLTDPTTSLHNQLDKSINRIPRTDVEYSHSDVLVYTVPNDEIWTCPKSKDLTEDQCCSINKSVGGNPMALLQVAIDLPFVRTFNRGFDELISSLTDPTTSLHNQLDKSINRIPRTDVEYSHIDVLVNLSLFKTAWFSFEQAAQIGVGLNKDSYGTKFNEKHERNTRAILSLLILRGQHLIEIDKQGVGEDISTSRNFILYWYSLHPLIYKHVHQKYVENVSEKDKHKKASLENARLRYMRYFCKEIDKFGEKYGTKPHEAQALLEKSRVHMKNFYEYFLNGTIRIDDVMTDTKGDKEFTTLDCKRYSLWKMLDYVQTAETKINFARRLSSDAERECKLYVYVYWTCKEVEFHLGAGQTKRACSIFTELSNKLGIVSDDVRTLLEQRLPWKLEDVERYPMFGVYFETKARTLKEENSKNKGIVDCLENARKLYNQSIKVTTKKQYQMLRRDDIARVVDSIGNYHFVNGDFNKSKEYHEKALCIVQKDKHGCAIK